MITRERSPGRIPSRRDRVVPYLDLPQRAAALASDYQGNPVNEYLQLYALGIARVFSDFADTAVSARVLFRLAHGPEFVRCFTGDDGRIRRQPCPGD